LPTPPVRHALRTAQQKNARDAARSFVRLGSAAV
jgi:hypothetical protein